MHISSGRSSGETRIDVPVNFFLMLSWSSASMVAVVLSVAYGSLIGIVLAP